MLGAGLLPDAKPVTGVIVAPPKAPTARYGKYLMSYQDCRECHGKDLSGGVPGQLPPLGPDLSIVKDWTRDEFITTMRTGVDPNGHQIGEKMPWRPIGRMDDDELAAMYQYLTLSRHPDISCGIQKPAAISGPRSMSRRQLRRRAASLKSF